MNQDFNNIIGAMGDLLSGLTDGDSNPLVRGVYQNGPAEVLVYPCIIILPGGTSDTYLNLRDIRRIYTLNLKIMVQLQETDTASQLLLRNINATVIDNLWKQTNFKLSNTIDYPTAINSNLSFRRELSDVYAADVTYSASKVINRYV